METKDDNLNPQQSLELIANMIRQTKGNASESSFYFLLWGWVITLCNFGMYFLLRFTHFEHPYIVWTLAIPAWIITMFYANKKDKSRGISTHLDKITMWLWIGMAISITPCWIFGANINWLVNAAILMPVGLATFLSGIIIRFKPLLFGGITFWIAGTLCYIASPVDQYLIGGVAMIFGYLVPGYMLKKMER